jgi:hypothetical protein
MRAAWWEEKGMRGEMIHVTARAATRQTARERVRVRKVFTKRGVGD